MNGSHNPTDIRTGLVIGIHKKELDFGRQVAALLPETDIRIVRIDQGLPQQESFRGRGYYYGAFHREIYLQLHQQVKNKIDLLIDLHTGINEAGRCADLFCSDKNLLGRLEKTLNEYKVNLSDHSPAVRMYEITTVDSQAPAASRRFPVCHTIIPRAVWNSAHYSYVGLEIYLPKAGKGKPADWNYGVGLVKGIIKANHGNP
ncbi:MAG: hypothetical protein JJV98_16550 [Desulfosarcina sp.]|nr:hypothetical protein [Desulfobacterales bacterium]